MPKGQKVRVITPRQDEIIRKCWDHNSYGHHAAKRAAQMTGLSPSVAHRRAMELGLVFTRERYRWTEPELRIVEANAHLALETIQRKLRPFSPPGIKRTRAAIAGQIRNQRFRTNLDGLNHGSLADAVGISPDRLRRCREANRIKGDRLESLRQACGYSDDIVDEHRHWFYSNDEIVRFLFACRGEIDLRKVNQTWLMGLLEPYIAILRTAPKRKSASPRATQVRKPRKPRVRKRKPRSSATRPRRPGMLGEAVVDAIRAGRPVLTRRGGPSTGAHAWRPGATVAGPNSKQNGGSSARGNDASANATSPSGSPSSGPVGGLSAVLHISGTKEPL